MDKRTNNRKRCLECKYYGCNVCPLMAGADVFEINKCILEYDAIKKIPKNSLDEFVFYNNPIMYFAYLGYIDKENYPGPGEEVITLSIGFSSSYTGKFLVVTREDDNQIFLQDKYGKEYCVVKSAWWKKLFKIEKSEDVN